MFSTTLRVVIFSLGLDIVLSQSCARDETWTDCVNPCNTCEQKGRCIGRPICRPGCDCKYEFLRDDTGLCVPHYQCEGGHQKCPENSVFLPCGSPCPPTCENPYPEECDEECLPSCYCKPGFLKREDGKCVRQEQCYARGSTDTCGKDEEYYDVCSPSCKNTCENINNPGVRCRCGPPGCFCREGLVKRSDGKCVPSSQCSTEPEEKSPSETASKCPPNAVFIECGSACPPTCENLQPEPCEEKCTTACYCKPGYLKSKDGKCVRPQHCNDRKNPDKSSKCPKNAIFIECGSPCPPTCEDRFPGPCEEKCTTACYCKPGYLKSKDNKCVLPQNCHLTKNDGKCQENEQYYEECTPSCKNTCENYNKPEITCPTCAPPGCFCKEGLLKRADGECVPFEQCFNTVSNNSQTSCSSPDEEFLECGSTCPDTCENKGRPISRQCSYRCVRGCFCKTGFFRTKELKCVLVSDCPNEEKTIYKEPPRNLTVTDCNNSNEEFLECGTTCPDTCENEGRPLPSQCHLRCVRGCFCKTGYFRTKEGTCVSWNDCTKEKKTIDKEPLPNITVTIPSTKINSSDSHGCPSVEICDSYCKTLGKFTGLCRGPGQLRCRCV